MFASGKGDVLLTYENEAIYANKKGVHTEYVLPKQTILIENPVALTKSGLEALGGEGFPEVPLVVEGAEALRRHRLQACAEVRRVEREVPLQAAEEPLHDQLKALGLRGWKSVQYRFFDHSSGIMVKVIGH